MKRFFIFLLFLSFGIFSFGFFRAAEAVIIPAVAKTSGAGGSFWQSDLFIFNPNSFPIKITLQFIPSGTQGSASNPIIVEVPQTVAAGNTLTIKDVLGTYFPSYQVGALIVWGENTAGQEAIILVNSRTYTPDPENIGTFGQGIPGIPWYYYGDENYAEEGLDKLYLWGLDQNDKYRTNLGILNISDRLTETISIKVYSPSNNLVGEIPVTLGPLAHYQINGILTQLGVEGEGYKAIIEVSSYIDNDPSNPDPIIPAVMAYASKVDNGLNDPTYIEAAFSVMPDIDCIW